MSHVTLDQLQEHLHTGSTWKLSQVIEANSPTLLWAPDFLLGFADEEL